MAGVLPLMLAIAGAAAGVEMFTRASRAADYPLFCRDERFGYGFAPNTAGSMRGRWRWRINDFGLRTDFDGPPGPESILLFGDSTVEDGAYTDQRDTLAARLARAIGREVYPVVCPAWSLENQLAYLRAHPALYAAGTMAFVTNSQDLAALNRWETESAQPTRRPLSHALYKALRATHLQRRMLFPSLFPPWADEGDRTWERSVSDLLRGYKGRIVWLFYPLREEVTAARMACAPLRPLLDDRVDSLEVTALPGWWVDCYQDEVHPNAKGRALLLDALTSALAPATR